MDNGFQPYIGDFLWVGLALAIGCIAVFNFVGVLGSSGTLLSKIPGFLLGTLFYALLIKFAWRRTIWSRRRRQDTHPTANNGDRLGSA